MPKNQWGLEFKYKGKWRMTDAVHRTKTNATKEGRKRFKGTKYPWRPVKIKVTREQFSVVSRPLKITNITISKVKPRGK